MLLKDFCGMLDELDWKYDIVKGKDGDEAITTGVSGKNFAGLRLLIIPDDDESAAIRCWQICKVSDSSRERVLDEINSLNQEYRWVKFAIDSDGDVTAHVDIDATTDTAAEILLRALLRTSEILDNVYPRVMKARFA